MAIVVCLTSIRGAAAQDRSGGTLAAETVALVLTSAGPLVGNGYSLARSEPFTLTQLIAGYTFGAGGLGMGIWGATQLGNSDVYDKTAVALSLATGAANLALAIYGTVQRRKARGRPIGPAVGDVLLGYFLGAGAITYGVAELAGVGGDRRMGGAAVALGALNLGLSIYQTVLVYRFRSRPPIEVVPITGIDAGRRLFAGLGVRFSTF